MNQGIPDSGKGGGGERGGNQKFYLGEGGLLGERNLRRSDLDNSNLF